MDLWAYQNRVQIDFSRPGKPTDNARVESFNGTLRAECLDVHWFATLTEAKQASNLGGGKTTRVVLTGLWGNERRVSCRKLTLKVTGKGDRSGLGELSF